MPSPTRSVRLRIPSYTPIPEGELSKTPGKDIIFLLNARRIQKELTDGAEVKTYYGRGSIELSFAMVRFTIMVDGWIGNEFSSIDHSAHSGANPVSGVEHSPDYIDMEEAAWYWNNAAGPNKGLDLMPELQMHHGQAGIPDGGFLVYKGLIRELEMVRHGAHAAIDFKLFFDVVWSPDQPGIREWAS